MWNYRVLKEEVDYKNEKLNRFRIVEVFYDEDEKITGWVDCADTILDWTGEEDSYANLKGNAEYVLHAFNKPILVKGEDKKLLYEIENKQNKEA